MSCSTHTITPGCIFDRWALMAAAVSPPVPALMLAEVCSHSRGMQQDVSCVHVAISQLNMHMCNLMLAPHVHGRAATVGLAASCTTYTSFQYGVAGSNG